MPCHCVKIYIRFLAAVGVYWKSANVDIQESWLPTENPCKWRRQARLVCAATTL